jgi:uncharacterized protein (TIGR00730 family)
LFEEQKNYIIKMSNKFTVAIFCGSSKGNNPLYEEKASELAVHLAKEDIGIVFGGSKWGLMGVISQTMVENNGSILGVIPEFFNEIEGHKTFENVLVVPDMHTRKKAMFDKADGFIALPGGVGTMEELVEMITWSKLRLHSKPIGLLNTLGFYDSFIEWVS